MFENETLKKIAAKHNKSVAQIILKYLTKNDIIVLAKTTNIDRMKEDISIFDFELDQEDMNEIKSLDGKKSLFFDHQDVQMVRWFDSIVYERRKK